MAAINSFIEPPPQSHPGDYSFASIVKYGSSQAFSWTDDYDFPLNLVLVQETAFLAGNSIQTSLDTLAFNITATNFNWGGEPTQNLSLSNLFWLGMFNASNGSIGPLFKSQYFNVTTSASSSSSSSSSSTTTASSSSTTSSPSSTGAPAVAAPTTSSTAKSTASHVALGAGLGAGLGGAALILAVALFFFLSRKRHNRSEKIQTREVYQLAENDTFSH